MAPRQLNPNESLSHADLFEGWRNWGEGANRPPDTSVSLNSPECVSIRNAAVTTFLGDLKRVGEGKGIPNRSEMEGERRSGQSFLFSRNRPTQFRNMAEYDAALARYQQIETTLRQEAYKYCPNFGDDRKSAQDWFFEGRKVSPQASRLFSEIISHAMKPDEAPAPVVESAGGSHEGPVDIASMTPMAVIFRPAIDPALPPSPVQAPPEVRVSDVLSMIAQGPKKKGKKSAKTAEETG